MTTITHELTLEGSNAAVRRALTTHAGITGWWCKDAQIGEGPDAQHELRFQKGDRRVVMRFRVEEVGDEEVRWLCTDNGNPVWKNTQLSWKLSQRQGATLLRFEHSGFAEDQSPPYKMTVEGWPPFLESLASYVATGQGQPA